MREAPTCKIEKVELISHGNTRIDDYFWLNNRDSEEVLEYMKDENQYGDAYFKNI